MVLWLLRFVDIESRQVSLILYTQFKCRDLFLMNQEFEDEANVPCPTPHWEQFSTYLKKSLRFCLLSIATSPVMKIIFSAARGLKPLRCHLTEEEKDLRRNRVFNKEFLTDYLNKNEKFLEMMRDRIENNTPIQPRKKEDVIN